MTRDERRASIVEATAPLLERYGQQLTTRQIAEAAGVAEGTIFRAFDSLQEVIEATLVDALSPKRLDALIANTSFPGNLTGDTECTFDVVNRYFEAVRAAFHIGHSGPAGDENARCAKDQLLQRYIQLSKAFTTHFTVYADELTITPAEFVRLLLTLASGQYRHKEIATAPLSRDLLVNALLHGVRKSA